MRHGGKILSASPVSLELHKVPAPLRSDLIESQQDYLGRSYVVFKNPLDLTYFRVGVSHAEAAREFDGWSDFGKIAEKLRSKSRYWRALTPEQCVGELSELSKHLAAAGLLKISGAGANERSRRIAERRRAAAWMQAFAKILYFKKSVFDPNALLEAMLPYCRWIFSRWALVVASIFVLASASLAMYRWEDICAQGADFFTLQNIVLTWGLFFAVKIVHEFAHALLAKRYGAEVHEMGFLFILLTPYLYCNVSDTWLANKRIRIAVSCAGIFAEILIAALATWLWHFSQPGIFHQLCFNTMVLCSVTTLVFNANPLMKFDGYYAVSDWLEIPNLRSKSQAWLMAWAQRTLMGIQAPKPTATAASPLFGVYAVAAYLYGCLVIYRISLYIFDILEPYGLQFLSRAYIAIFLFISLAIPLYRLLSSVKSFGKIRLRLAPLIIVLASSALFFIPWTETVQRKAVLENEKISSVSAPLDGFLRSVQVLHSAPIATGQVLGQLENKQLDSLLAEAHLECAAAEVQHRAALTGGTSQQTLSASVLAKSISEAKEKIANLEKKSTALELTANENVILRTPNPENLLGRFFTAGQRIFEMGSGEKIIIALDEKELRRIAIGQRVKLRFDALPSRIFHATISSVPAAPTREFSAPALANIFGGSIPAEVTPSGQVLPLVPLYEVDATLDETIPLRPQATARATIEIRQTTLARLLRDIFYDLLDPQINL